VIDWLSHPHPQVVSPEVTWGKNPSLVSSPSHLLPSFAATRSATGQACATPVKVAVGTSLLCLTWRVLERRGGGPKLCGQCQLCIGWHAWCMSSFFLGRAGSEDSGVGGHGVRDKPPALIPDLKIEATPPWFTLLVLGGLRRLGARQPNLVWGRY
jgi:hypothetical protein